ncbi:NAD(+) diphosphatase [Leucobacter tenebrionis]|uniref:NAD(+) diphosphatase n=1 Tax=Leucobacter tenebrionis TaxID=2873270 RepID=UPI001CA64382|nr:NAD(+) diphosphatase [Leucobacter tenebrionis]QZY52471.1 NAD(+) diphosphatase [Leucobacter tenebrionis]
MIVDYPPLAGSALDRDAETRADIERLRSAWREPSAKLLRVRGVEIPVIEGPASGEGEPRLALIGTDGEFEEADHDLCATHLYLGRAEGDPVFATLIAEHDSEASVEVPGEEWRHPFEIADRLPEYEREMISVASGLIRWHESSRFSPRDGSLTEPGLGGWMRRDGHGGEHFPRTDPAVIVLIEHEDRVLLGSNALWESGRFSLLAGFVETGESLEQAVSREVFEESGVHLSDIRYVTSQPWPFPRSLMLGFRARLAADADPLDLNPDPEEISELRWFSRDELRSPGPGITLPMPLSIARWMIDRWVAEGAHGD